MLYSFFWLDGKKELLSGNDPAEALNQAGYGRGAVTALDFYGAGDITSDFIWDKDQHKWVCCNLEE